MKRFVVLAAFILAVALAVSGCTWINGARLTVRLTDALPEDVDQVWVEISEVRLKACDEPEEGAGTILLSSVTRTVNLLDLRNDPLVLANAAIPPGEYDQIQFVVRSAKVVLSNGEEHDLFIPGSNYRENQENPDVVKLAVVKGLLKGAAFEAGKQYGVTIDFDVNSGFHLHQTGSSKYILRPVIHVVLDDVSGRIIGRVVEMVDGNQVPIKGAAIVVARGETTVMETSTDDDGMFYANALLLSTYAGGDYTVTISAEGYKTIDPVTVSLDATEVNLNSIVLEKQ